MHKQTILIALIFCLLAACTGNPVKITASRFPAGKNLSAYGHSYYWGNEGKPYVGYYPVDADELDRDIRSSVDAELAKLDWRQTDKTNAELIVRYYTSIISKTDVEETYKYYRDDPTRTRSGSVSDAGYEWPFGAAPAGVREYEQGSVFIDIVDPATDKVLWRGTATTTLDPQTSAKKRRAKIAKTIKTIFAKFAGETK